MSAEAVLSAVVTIGLPVAGLWALTRVRTDDQAWLGEIQRDEDAQRLDHGRQRLDRGREDVDHVPAAQRALQAAGRQGSRAVRRAVAAGARQAHALSTPQRPALGSGPQGAGSHEAPLIGTVITPERTPR